MRIINLSQPEIDQLNQPETLIVYTTQNDVCAEMAKIREKYPDLNIMGLSSFHGIMMPNGYKRGTFGMLFEASDDIKFRQMMLEFSDKDDIKATVCDSLKEWKNDVTENRQFFIHGIQGVEERVIEGLCELFGENTQIFGCTAGNDCFLNHAYVFLNDKKVTYGVLIIEVLGDLIQSFVTRGGYLTTLRKGILTRVNGRILETIDGRPAAEVYNEWTDRRFDANILRGGELPRSAGLYPLAHYVESEPECGSWLVHPHFVDKETKSLHLFAEIPQDTEVFLMRGSEDTLISRMETAVREMLGQISIDSIDAAFIMYCAGCASIISEKMPVVCQAACKALNGIPFIGCLSFGEQGRLSHAHHNRHGNMMIELVIVRRKTA